MSAIDLLSKGEGKHVVTMTQSEAREKIQQLIEKFRREQAAGVIGQYNESETPGTQKVEFELEQSKEFDELLFARGIHKIAFNSYAFRFGQNNALQNRLNNLRRYVRKADRDELWIYAVKESQDSGDNFVAIIRNASWGEVVELRILCLDFLVSLSGWRREIEKDLKEGDICIVRHKGQWQEGSLLGLK